MLDLLSRLRTAGRVYIMSKVCNIPMKATIRRDFLPTPSEGHNFLGTEESKLLNIRTTMPVSLHRNLQKKTQLSWLVVLLKLSLSRQMDQLLMSRRGMLLSSLMSRTPLNLLYCTSQRKTTDLHWTWKRPRSTWNRTFQWSCF